MNNIIPPMTSFYSRYWEQPDPDEILVDDSVAVMSQKTFNQLKEYSTTFPTGVYTGKMWRATADTGEHYLVWYGEEYEHQGKMVCNVENRRIQIFDWKAYMGVPDG